MALAYRKALPDSNWLRFQEGFGNRWIASTCILSVANGTGGVESEIARMGGETRRWWAKGAHAHPATSSFPRTLLPTTESLVNSVVALPFYRDLKLEDVHRVCEVVTKVADL